MTDQRELVALVLRALAKTSQFAEVKVVGSISSGRHDGISDIDILICEKSRAPWGNVTLASKILGDALGVTLRDWAGSLIPKKYLISHFLPGYPIFWWVDLGSMSDGVHDDISRNEIPQEKDAHLAKLLIMNAKHFLRGDVERLRIEELHEKIYPDHETECDVATMFEQVHKGIDYSGIAEEFREKTLLVMKEVADRSAAQYD